MNHGQLSEAERAQIRAYLESETLRDDDHHSSTKASIALLYTGIAGLIVAAGLLAMVAR
jgi:hypothetical protein